MRQSLFGAVLGAGLVIAVTAGRSLSEPAGGPLLSSSPFASSGALITHVTPSDGEEQMVTVIDPQQRVMAVYQVERATGKITPKSIRNFTWDLQMIEYNSGNPLPQDIRSGLQAESSFGRSSLPVADSEEFMAQKFTSLEDAANQLGISKERLNQLREAGKVRAYRDGASWKFRSDDVDKFATTGIPQIDPSSSDLALESADEAASSGLDLDMADEAPAGPVSDINLEEVDEPTVAGVEEDDSDAMAIDLDDDSISLSDSILLSEAELGTSPGRPPSTIIGRGELDLDADLDLSPAEKSSGAASDVTMASESDLGLDLPSPSGDFAGLEEVEVDLEAESSRILSPEETAKVRGAAAAAKAAETSDLELAPTDSDLGRATSDIGLGGDAADGTGLTGLSALELEDDEVLGDGSDVTLSGESSGINIISPSDSGLALDEVALDLSGSSPIASSLELGDAETSDVGLEPLGSEIGVGSKVGEDFQLTPLGEEGADDEKDSSQVIALDELSEETAGSPLGAPVSESGMLAEDFGVGLTPGAVVVSDATAETPFSMWNVMGLASCMLLLGLCSMMMFDLLRNMWSWDGVAPLNSSLLEVVNPFL